MLPYCHAMTTDDADRYLRNYRMLQACYRIDDEIFLGIHRPPVR